MDHSEIIEQYRRKYAQFDDYLGMDFKVYAPGKVSYTLEVKDHHLATIDACHGGVISAMMDAVLGLTCLTYTLPKGNLCATVEFKISFLSEAKHGDLLEATGEIDFPGSSWVAASGQIRELESGRLIAKAMGTFSQYPVSKKMDSLGISRLETT